MTQKMIRAVAIAIFCWNAPLLLAQTERLPKIEYQVVDEVLDQASDTFKVALTLIVSGELSRNALRNILQKAQADVERRVRADNQGTLASIVIWAYVSKLHVQSQELWLARLQKMGKEPPQIRFNDAQFELLSRQPEKRLGLSEAERKKIWQNLQEIEHKARQEAQARFPSDPQNFKDAGQFFRLSERLALLQAEPFATNPPAEMSGVVSLAPQTQLTLLKSVILQGRRWHYVQARIPLADTVQEGWVEGLNLLRQRPLINEEDQKTMQTLSEGIKWVYQRELAARFGLSLPQLAEIFLEGILKNWPLPLSVP